MKRALQEAARVKVLVGSAAVFASVLLASAALPEAIARPGAAAGQLRPGAVRELARGKLLVAARGLPDPNFAEAVVLLAEMNEHGAMGIIVNRPTEATLSNLLPGREHANDRGTAYFGGPVQVSGVVALLRSERARTDCRRVFGDVYLVNVRSVLDELLTAGTGPNRFRVYVGYAGWGSGQLERETAQGGWHVVDGDADIVFDPDPDTMWQRQIRLTEGVMARHRLPRPAPGTRALFGA